jgi:hypothetical protein
MMLEAAFDRPQRMRRAYRARNSFRKIFALKSRQAADTALREWEESLHPSIASAFEGVTRALENGRTEILRPHRPADERTRRGGGNWPGAPFDRIADDLNLW